MKYILVIVANFAFTLNIVAQNEVYLGFSETFSSFSYKNSFSEKDDFLNSDVKSGSTIGYNFNKLKSFDLRTDLSFLNLGAKGSYETELVNWNLNYLNLNVNFGYRHKSTMLQPYFLIGPYFSYLYKGSQEFGSNYYNLIDLKKIKRIDMGATSLVGINFIASSSVSLFMEGRHTYGIYQIESDQNSQKLFNRAFSFLLGIRVKIEKKSENDESSEE